MKLRYSRLLPIAASALGLMLICQLGCNAPTRDVNPPIDKTYRLAGALVKDQNQGAFGIAAAVVKVFKNGDIADNLAVAVGDNTLEFNNPIFGPDIYADVLGAAESLLVGAEPVFISDGTVFADTLFVVVPGTPSISAIAPTRKGPGDKVSLQWTGAVNADGYFVAAVKEELLYDGIGWSEPANQAATSLTINDSAFTRFNLQGGEPDPGIYYVFVYAYTGAPDRALTADWLPVPLPFQIGNNVDEVDLMGHVGTVVVSEPRVIEVLAAP